MQKQYKLNTETLSYELISSPTRKKTYSILKKILLALIAASILNLVFSLFMFTPKMQKLISQREELILRYELLQEKISVQTQRLEQIKHRDHKIYRNIFGVDSLTIKGIYTPYSQEKYSHFQYNNYAALMSSTWMSLDQLTRLSYAQSKSLDQLQQLSKDKEKLATAIPAIWPIDKSAQRGSIGLFGMRKHPILKRYLMHYGADLSSPKGTAVYATADGVVIKNPAGGAAYGKYIFIDHGFGYKTKYAHLSAIYTQVGQHVKRGEQIGEVGSTGRSTGPHLHYEVIYQGKHVDPLNYFKRDMSKEELEKIIENAKATTYEVY